MTRRRALLLTTGLLFALGLAGATLLRTELSSRADTGAGLRTQQDAASGRGAPAHPADRAEPLSEWPRATIHVGLQRLRVEVADTPERRSQGLSGRARLAPGAGMYFPIHPPARRVFWMKEMHFDLDILWIRNGRIVQLSARVPHGPGRASRVQPDREVDAVLEVQAGSIERWGWRVGETIEVLGWPPAD